MNVRWPGPKDPRRRTRSVEIWRPKAPTTTSAGPDPPLVS
jgi:hypothetical protein